MLDLSDEPVLGPAAALSTRFRVLLAAGLPYVGADFRLEPPELEPFPLPSLSVFATGKRVGKTAVSAHVARLLAQDREVVVVAMGRGGPETPEIAETPPGLAELLDAVARAVAMPPPTIWRSPPLPASSRSAAAAAGAVLPAALPPRTSPPAPSWRYSADPDFVVFDGSGAAIPPVATGKRVLVTSVFDPPELVTGYLNAYRILLADLVLLTMADAGTPHRALAEAIREVKPGAKVIAVGFRPRPLAPVDGKRVAYFTTAAPSAHERLAEELRAAGRRRRQRLRQPCRPRRARA